MKGGVVREVLLALILLAASSLVVAGVAMLFAPAAYVVAGTLLAALGWLFLVEG